MKLFQNILERFRKLREIKLHNPLSLNKDENLKPSFEIWFTSMLLLVSAIVTTVVIFPQVLGIAILLFLSYQVVRVIRYIFTGKQ